MGPHHTPHPPHAMTMTWQVAEMTGRKGRLERDASGRTVYVKRNEGLMDEDDRRVSQDKINLTERKHFMDGKKVCATAGRSQDLDNACCC